MTSLYSKPTDSHQYKRLIIYSQTLRVKRVFSQESDFKEYSSKPKSWFLKIGYPEKLIDTEMKKVLSGNNRKVNNKTEKGIPFAVTFHPRLNILQKIIDKNFYLLHMNEKVKKAFTPKRMISYRSSRKISSYLVRAKLYPVNRIGGCFKCDSKRCEVCKYITETDTFTSTVTGETFKINHRFDCNDKCLVYLMTCNKCKKQCTGQTTDQFCSKWNNYKSKSRSFDRGEQCMQEHLYKHFEGECHSGFCEYVSVILTDETDGSSLIKRETYWMQTRKTIALHGLNVENSA